jgi:hypothetical protein
MLVGRLEQGAPRLTALAHGERFGAKAGVGRHAHARPGQALGLVAVERVQLYGPREAGPGVAHHGLAAPEDARGHGDRGGRSVRSVVAEKYRVAG